MIEPATGVLRRVPAGAALLAIVFAYAVLAFAVLTPKAVYSGDIGVKYVQARALAGHRFTSLDIPYRGESIDSGREFFPVRPPFILQTGGAPQAIFSPVSAALQALWVWPADLPGLILLSIAGGALVLWAAMRLVPPDQRVYVLAVLGFGSPLWFYAVSGWEHALAVGLGTAGFLAALATPQPSAWMAGALVGAGATVRDEVLLLLPGVLVALWRTRRTVPAPLVATASAIVILAGAAAVEIWWFQRPPAAHVRHAVHLVQTAAHLTSAPNPEVPALQPLTWRERYDTVVSYWLMGYGNTAAVLVFALTLAATLALWRLGGSPRARAAGRWLALGWLMAFFAVTAWDVWGVLTAPRWVAGLFRLSPFLVFALLPRPADEPAERLPRAVAITAGLYVLVAFVGTDTTGGKSLGPRLLLPLLPIMAAAAVARITGYLRAPGGIDRTMGRLGLALAGCAIAMHVAGTIPAYVQRNREDAATLRTIASIPQPYVLADDEFVAQMLLPLYFRKIILLVDSRELGRAAGQRLTEARVPRVVMVTRRSTPAISLYPYEVERIEPAGRLVIQYWRRH